ncbi:LOW QUALITY PROTEIN: hypothetical protein FGSG_13042 [Fusarium graminearum PH-1]|uniref:hypothetical protein n=1 Tax=Gibberella zeae (strain ATCC MYA-4620 / CBS 123657 / FGSC 9075 / NRRL 31084 / PH-1) TaxID=229533 RepID=UPI00021F2037|nr:LOW QUALITY PROTEIN: hypothetical protein FGSG_13042 [Fusarium graminearum PH-1]ESU13204.1 LOW QUALITY PROTEIN: hypothetical protein FGSG_13042 [Fusarium graminearum PH-1]|eukprot:XP_011326711.1 LOW QUALITY PROTEIN: hypothetical protein FGSG_13042 [Fusarium graminearum PH-1]
MRLLYRLPVEMGTQLTISPSFLTIHLGSIVLKGQWLDSIPKSCLHQASILFSQRVTHRISEAPGYPMIVLIPNKLCVVNKPEVREVRKVISVEVWRDERPYLLCLSPGSTREKGKIYPIKAEIFLA